MAIRKPAEAGQKSSAMAVLLAGAGMDSTFKSGSIVEGTVTAVKGDDVFTDIGYKSEGIVHLDEFLNPADVVAGYKFNVMIVSLEDDRTGMLVLSKRRADDQIRWKMVQDRYTEGCIVTGTIRAKVNGGLIVDVQRPARISFRREPHARAHVHDSLRAGQVESFPDERRPAVGVANHLSAHAGGTVVKPYRRLVSAAVLPELECPEIGAFPPAVSEPRGGHGLVFNAKETVPTGFTVEQKAHRAVFQHLAARAQRACAQSREQRHHDCVDSHFFLSVS